MTRSGPPGWVSVGIGRVRTWLLTGNSPVKIGIIVSLIGLGFLVREASVRGWVDFTIEMRLAAATVFGLAMLGFGWHQRARRPIYGLSLQGGGIAVLYLVTLASYALYDLLPPLAALAAVVLITVAAGTLAMIQNSLTLAMLGLIGGYSAPLLAFEWPRDHLAVFSAYAVLGAAVVTVGRLKAWPLLMVSGYLSTFVVAGLWLFARQDNSDWLQLQPFVAYFVLLYALVPLAWPPVPSGRAEPIGFENMWITPLVFCTPFAGLAMQAALVGHLRYGVAISCAVLAVAYATLHQLSRRQRSTGKQFELAYAALAVVFCATAVPLFLGASATSAIWAVQGAVLVWAASRWGSRLALLGGAVLQASAAVAYGVRLTSDSVDGDSAAVFGFWAEATPVVNAYALGAVLLAACGLASAESLRRSPHFEGWRPWAQNGALVWGVGWWLFAAATQLWVVTDDYRLWALSLLVVGTLSAVVVVGRKLRWHELEWAGVLMLPTLSVALVVAMTSKDYPSADWGWTAWPFMIVAYAAFLRTGGDRLTATGLSGGLYGVLSVFLAAEVYGQLAQTAERAWPLYGAAAALLLWLWASLRARPVASWFVGDGWRDCLLYGITPVAWAAAAGAGIAVVNHPGNVDPLQFLPILNPVDIFAAASVVLLLRWKREMVAELSADSDSLTPAVGSLLRLAATPWRAALSAAGVAALTMSAARTVHHWADVPFDLRSLVYSTELQVALSILWAATALAAMVVGVRAADRRIWIVGASWMGVVVIKLFLVDLANLAALPKAGSFIGVGIVLMIVGYLAPVPPSQSETQQSEDESR